VVYIRTFHIYCQILVTFYLGVVYIIVLDVFYEFHENQCREFCILYVYTCAVKHYYVLDVKNTSGKSFILCHRVHHLKRCVLSEEYNRDVSARLELKV
jgi:hypothetical protein